MGLPGWDWGGFSTAGCALGALAALAGALPEILQGNLKCICDLIGSGVLSCLAGGYLGQVLDIVGAEELSCLIGAAVSLLTDVGTWLCQGIVCHNAPSVPSMVIQALADAALGCIGAVAGLNEADTQQLIAIFLGQLDADLGNSAVAAY